MTRARGKFSPSVALALLALWLLLNQTLAPAHILLGALLGSVVAAFTAMLRPLQAHLHRFDAALWLLLVVTWDILHSNLQVALIVLGAKRRGLRSGFLDIPLDLRDAHGLAALATIVTATPGTVWAGLSGDSTRLTLHVLDLDDEAALIRQIKSRYEQPLMRIFE